ncbi:MAG TPA: hypothetical protein PK159_14630 [Steroidobacteraceae bacterium]|nr:hypothetical protein [Steroidobacteraceae bacterium]
MEHGTRQKIDANQPSELRASHTHLVTALVGVLMGLLLSHASAIAGPSAHYEEHAFKRAQYVCEWAKTHPAPPVPKSKPVDLRICIDLDAMNYKEVRKNIDDWFSQFDYAEVNGSGKAWAAFEAWYSSELEALAVPEQLAKVEEEKAARKAESEFHQRRDAIAAKSKSHRKIVFLCDWAKTRMPASESSNVCDPTALSSASPEIVEANIGDYWAAWARIDANSAAEQQKAFEAAYNAKFPPPPRQLSANDLQGMKVDALCGVWRSERLQSALKEILRRRVFTPSDFRLIEGRSIALGMSESALVCSWGTTEVNRDVGSWGVHKQYVYGQRNYVYVENGFVTAYQD